MYPRFTRRPLDSMVSMKTLRLGLHFVTSGTTALLRDDVDLLGEARVDERGRSDREARWTTGTSRRELLLRWRISLQIYY